MNNYFIGKIGILFIAIGAVGAIGIMLSFDWETFNRYSELAAYEEELAFMKQERFTMFVTAGACLLANAAIGSVLMALDKIIYLLEKSVR